jgi:ABC-type uncharacterized transport system fused permease/ATPase subunit
MSALTWSQVPAATRLTFQQRKFDGDLRFAHNRVREFSEAISFYGGEAREQEVSDDAFRLVYHNFRRLAKRDALITLFSRLGTGVLNISPASFTNVLGFLSVFIVVRSGQRTIDGIEDVSTVALTISSAILALLAIPQLYAKLTPIAGDVHRLGQMYELMQRMKETREQRLVNDNTNNNDGGDDGGVPQSELVHGKVLHSAHVIKLASATIAIPTTGRILYENVSLEVKSGDSLCIYGPSGTGKSSVLRVLAGLWPVFNGTLTTPRVIGRDGVFFVPQKLYTTLGTLREQVIYPHSLEDDDGEDRTAEIEHILRLVKLDAVLEAHGGLDVQQNWDALLSGGESQRLGFARLWYHMPRFAIIDEGTAALDGPLQALVMRECLRRNITCISVAHREELVQYHRRIMRLSRGGTYTITEVKDFVGNNITAEIEEKKQEEKNTTTDDAKQSKKEEKEEEEEEEEEEHEDASATNQEDEGYGCLFLHRLAKLLRLTFRGWCSKASVFLYMALIANALMASWRLYIIQLFSQSFSELASEGQHGAARSIATLALNVLFFCCCVAVSTWLGKVLSIYWRRDVLTRLHMLYFVPRVPYIANVLDARIDNVDNRMNGDLQRLTEELASLMFGDGSTENAGVVPMIFCTLGLLYSTFNDSWMPPVGTIAFVLLCALVMQCLVQPIARATANVQEHEGSFRYAHGRLRVYTESIAFMRGEQREFWVVDRLFSELYASVQRWIRSAIPLKTFAFLSIFIGILSSYVLVAFAALYLITLEGDDKRKKYNVSVMIARVGALGSVFNLLPGRLGVFGLIAGYTHRVAKLLELLEDVHAALRESAKSKLRMVPGPFVELEHVSVVTPLPFSVQTDVLEAARASQRTLLENVSLKMNQKSVICMGQSGCGKSSLLRVIGGLWTFPRGVVTRPMRVGRGGIFFLPQKPYFCPGSLRAQLVYPNLPDASQKRQSRPALLKILRFCELEHLAAQFRLDDDSVNWADMLSLGEQQRLGGFCRVFFQQPRFVVMDESSSALSETQEAKMLGACRARGIVMLSVAHRDSCVKFHDVLLRLTPNASSRFKPSVMTLEPITTTTTTPTTTVSEKKQ